MSKKKNWMQVQTKEYVVSPLLLGVLAWAEALPPAAKLWCMLRDLLAVGWCVSPVSLRSAPDTTLAMLSSTLSTTELGLLRAPCAPGLPMPLLLFGNEDDVDFLVFILFFFFSFFFLELSSTNFRIFSCIAVS